MKHEYKPILIRADVYEKLMALYGHYAKEFKDVDLENELSEVIYSEMCSIIDEVSVCNSDEYPDGSKLGCCVKIPATC